MFQEYGSESDFAIYAYSKVIMQGKLFQRCTHLLCCSVLSLGGNVNTRRMSKPEMGSIYIYRIYLTNTDTPFFVYNFRPERTGFNMYAEYTQLQLTFLALAPCRALCLNLPIPLIKGPLQMICVTFKIKGTVSVHNCTL